MLAADIVGLKARDPALDSQFRAKLAKWLDAPTSSGPDSLRICSNLRPNNWGTHCTASRIAIDLYLGTAPTSTKRPTSSRGWMGDRAAYSGFDLWRTVVAGGSVCAGRRQPEEQHNQRLQRRGLQPEKMRRAVRSSGRQSDRLRVGRKPGALASTWMLMRAGYADQWSDRAECRVAGRSTASVGRRSVTTSGSRG